MKSKIKIIIFSLLMLAMLISAASAHENIITDENGAIDDDLISVNHFDDGLDDSDDDSDDLDDEWDKYDDLDDEDWDDFDDDSDDLDDDWYDDFDDFDDDDLDDDWYDDWYDWYDDFDDFDDDDWDDYDDDVWYDDLGDDDWDDWYDDSDDFDDDLGDEDWDDLDDDWYDDFDDFDDDDWDDYDDDFDDDYWNDSDDWDYDWDGNHTTSCIKFYKLISSCHEPLLVYKTTSSVENMTHTDSGIEDDCEDEYDDDSQEESAMEELQSFMTFCFGASASFDVPDVLSQNHESVSKSISQGQNLLDDEKDDDVNVTDEVDYDTIPLSSDNDLNVFGLLVSLLLCIMLLI